MKRLAAAVLLLLLSFAVYGLPTVEDVQHAVHRGDYSAAESMVREVISARPNNAKAHYILAELLLHEGKRSEAKQEAARAAALDPAITFTDRQKFEQFNARLGNGAVPEPHKQTGDAGSPVFNGQWILLLVGAGVIFLLLRRRAAAPGGVSDAPVAPAPQGPVSGGSGVGRTVAAGLGGIAAGMLAEHLLEEHRHAQRADAAPVADSQRIDFGNGSDWGNDSGGGDSGSSFDSGGSSWD